MTNTFSSSSFSNDISNWYVSQVTDFYGMFSSTPFNIDISSWSVQAGCNFADMFGFSDFNQDLNSWKARVTSPLSTCTSVKNFFGMFDTSKCPIQSNSLPNDALCQSTNAPSSSPSSASSNAPSKKPVSAPVVKFCVRKAFNMRGWCCQKRNKCKLAITAECKPSFLATGKTSELLREHINTIVRNNC